MPYRQGDAVCGQIWRRPSVVCLSAVVGVRKLVMMDAAPSALRRGAKRHGTDLWRNAPVDHLQPPPDSPPGLVTVRMAGLLTCGSLLACAFPSHRGTVALQGRSPLTVAGAVTDLAAVAYTLPYSLFIRRRLCALPEPSPPVWTKARRFVNGRSNAPNFVQSAKALRAAPEVRVQFTSARSEHQPDLSCSAFAGRSGGSGRHASPDRVNAAPFGRLWVHVKRPVA